MARSVGTLGRYILLQIPGNGLTGLVLLWLWQNDWLPATWAVGLFALSIAKDAALYPFLRSAYEFRDEPVGPERMIGCRGVARGDLDPRGFILVEGELWKARLPDDEPPVPARAPVRVEHVNGFTLIVRPDERSRGSNTDAAGVKSGSASGT